MRDPLPLPAIDEIKSVFSQGEIALNILRFVCVLSLPRFLSLSHKFQPSYFGWEQVGTVGTVNHYKYLDVTREWEHGGDTWEQLSLFPCVPTAFPLDECQ